MSKSISAAERISTVKIDLMEQEPFLAVLGVKTRHVLDNNEPTMYVNGKIMGFNEEFVLAQSKGTLKGVVAHEIMHIALLHLYRRGARNSLLYNYATDFAINWILRESKFDLPDGGLYSADFANMGAEVIYDKLVEALKKEGIDPKSVGKNPSGGQQQSGGQQSGGQQSGGQQSGGQQSGGQQSGGQSGGQQSGDQGSGPSNKQVHDALSKHFDIEGDRVVGSHDMWDKNMSAEQKQRATDDLASAVRQAQMVANMKRQQQGKGSSLIDRMIDELLKPKITWQKYVKSLIRPRELDTCYTNPDRYYSYRGDIDMSMGDIPFPGDTPAGEKLEGVVFVLDTSGSITRQEATGYLSEMQGLMRQFPDTLAMYMSCDYDCTDPVDLQTVDGTTIDLKTVKLKGGGGTSFKPPFEFFAAPENKRKFDVQLLVYFTDAYGDFPTEKPPYPTIFCVTTDAIKNVPDWAIAIDLR